MKHFSRETFSSALELGRKALISLGMHPHQAQRAQMHFRRLDMRMLRELMPVHGYGADFPRAGKRVASWRRFSSARCSRNDASWTAGTNLNKG